MDIYTADTCPVCSHLGEHLKTDNMEGEQFPPEFHKLETVPDTDGDIFRCPQCGQAYLYINKYDNDVYNLYDISELIRIDEQSVQAAVDRVLLEKEKARSMKEKYRRAADRYFKNVLEDLPADERQILELLVDASDEGIPLRSISQTLSISPERCQEVIDHFEKTGMLRRTVNYPMSPGEHNFQETDYSVDPFFYTTVYINLKIN